MVNKKYIESYVGKYRQQEDNFAKLLEQKGYGKTLHSTKNQDYKEHWDVKLINNKKNILIDVKAMKKIKRSDEKVNENYHYVELKNGAGYNGWLYSGKANCIAFEMINKWIVVDKTKLIKLINDKCLDNLMYEYPMPYKHYHHNDNDDIVLVESNDLIKISRIIINK